MATVNVDVNSLKWYVLDDYINLFFPVFETNVALNYGDTLVYTNFPSSSRYDISPPTSQGINTQIAQYFATDRGYTTTEREAGETSAIDPGHFKYLSREKAYPSSGFNSDNWYIYKLSSNMNFGLNNNNTDTSDIRFWIKDSTGTIYPTTTGVQAGLYSVPWKNSSNTPATNVKQIAGSSQYGITNQAEMYTGSGWSHPSQSDWEYPYYYFTRFINPSYMPNGGINQYYNEVLNISKNFEEYEEDTNPYQGSNDKEPDTSGGEGGRTNWTDTVPIYDAPTANILDLGLSAIYTPTETQFNDFASFLWSDAFSVDSLKKIFADPINSIISAHMLPFSVTHGLEAEIKIGNIGSGVNADILGAQYYKKSMGSLSIAEYYGNFFDYSPYTKYQIYLPYIGYKEFLPDDFVGGTIEVIYYIDAVTGKCVVCLYSSKADAILYQYEGNLLYQIPITQSSYTSMITGWISAGISIVGDVISGGKTSITQVAGAAASAVAGSKPDISRSGSIGGASGWLASQTPYIVRLRPSGIIAKNQQVYTGYPSYQSVKLSKLSGFTQVSDINLSLNGATSSEYDEARALLESGVII